MSHPGETRHFRHGKDEYFVRAIENVGDTEPVWRDLSRFRLHSGDAAGDPGPKFFFTTKNIQSRRGVGLRNLMFVSGNQTTGMWDNALGFCQFAV
jgi:hypothetical protein